MILNIIINNEFLRLTLILLIPVLANIVLGLRTVGKENPFDFKKLLKSIYQGFMLWLGTGLIYLEGYFLPDMKILDINGASLTIQGALSAIVMVAVGVYLYKAVSKIIDLLGVKEYIKSKTITEEEIKEEEIK